jgi:hypothetical protein
MAIWELAKDQTFNSRYEKLLQQRLLIKISASDLIDKCVIFPELIIYASISSDVNSPFPTDVKQTDSRKSTKALSGSVNCYLACGNHSYVKQI